MAARTKRATGFPMKPEAVERAAELLKRRSAVLEFLSYAVGEADCRLQVGDFDEEGSGAESASFVVDTKIAHRMAQDILHGIDLELEVLNVEVPA